MPNNDVEADLESMISKEPWTLEQIEALDGVLKTIEREIPNTPTERLLKVLMDRARVSDSVN
jgi:hypothetical protein